ncbi:MAG: hypothetical protein ACI4IV_06475 [Acutalibacteraceae bacterium]
MSNNEEFKKLIEKYNREMEQLIAGQNAAVIPRKQGKTNDSALRASGDIGQRFGNGSEYIPPSGSQGIPDGRAESPHAAADEVEAPPTQDDDEDTAPTAAPFGTLSVSATTADGALPVEGAYIVVTEVQPNGEERLVYSAKTDRNGMTAPIRLATLPEELSLNPDYFGPTYKAYKIVTSKDGFFTVIDKNVPIFANRSAIQPVNMIPLPENFSGDRNITFDESMVQSGTPQPQTEGLQTPESSLESEMGGSVMQGGTYTTKNKEG